MPEYDTKQSHSMISLVGKSNENLEDPFTNFATNFTNYTLPDSLCSDIPTPTSKRCLVFTPPFPCPLRSAKIYVPESTPVNLRIRLPRKYRETKCDTSLNTEKPGELTIEGTEKNKQACGNVRQFVSQTQYVWDIDSVVRTRRRDDGDLKRGGVARLRGS
ncbi:hypothetical protein V1477_000301 [Vespula maculifrons]|uniref:Uncharacterized protein n=1 Tax=Vespula maculifrons TaxID=7453 RepID=A0ABD2D3N0_VESMC